MTIQKSPPMNANQKPNLRNEKVKYELFPQLRFMSIIVLLQIGKTAIAILFINDNVLNTIIHAEKASCPQHWTIQCVFPWVAAFLSLIPLHYDEKTSSSTSLVL